MFKSHQIRRNIALLLLWLPGLCYPLLALPASKAPATIAVAPNSHQAAIPTPRSSSPFTWKELDLWLSSIQSTLEPDLPPDPLPTLPLVIQPITTTIAPPSEEGKALVINQTTQTVIVYEDGQKVKTLPISTGKRYSYTPAFRGRVGRYVPTLYGFGTLADHAWYLTEATGAIYLHGAPYLQVDGRKVYQDLEAIGVRPSSHGCIRLHPTDAAWLARWDPRDASIIITRPDFERFTD